MGAGNVASALCEEMFARGHNIVRIVSETEERGLLLADSCNALWSDKPDFTEKSDILIVAVPDNRLRNVLSKIKCGNRTVVVHTAGSFGLEVFPGKIKHPGVLYPLQTFTRGRSIDFKELNFLAETSDQFSFSILKNLTLSLGSKIMKSEAGNRKMLHLAAVFVCNFTNHMFTAGKEISSIAGFPFEILEPLITETYNKAVDKGPEISQTGPAVRHDIKTIKKHLKLLSFKPEYREMYMAITSSIIEYYKKR